MTGIIDGGDEQVGRFVATNPLVETIDLLLPDLNGVLCGQRIAVTELPAVLRRRQRHSSGIYATEVSGRPARPLPPWWKAADLPLGVDIATLKPVPWRPDRAQLLGGLLNEDGTAFFADPRALLGTLERRLALPGLHVTLELDFYLLERELGPGGPVPARVAPDLADMASHDRLADHEEFLDLVAQWTDIMEMQPPAIAPGEGPSQFKLSLAETGEVLPAADNLVLMKRLLQAAARATGRRATFMAMPLGGQPGSSLGIGVRLGQTGQESGPATGAASTAALCTALRDLGTESMALLAPNANSLRRLQILLQATSAETEGRAAPAMAALIARAPGEEAAVWHRLAGADANPYLACACVLAGLLHWLEHGIDEGSGSPRHRDGANAILAWDAALDAFRDARHLPGYIGRRFCELFHACRQSERRRFIQEVTPTEWRWHLGG